MKKSVLLAVVLSAMPVFASGGEVGLFAGRQTYRDGSWSIPAMNWTWDYSNADKTVYGVRAGYAFVETDAIRWNATAAFQPEISTDLTVGVKYGSTFSTINSSYKHGYTAIGSMLTFKAPVSVSLGLDYRFEKATMDAASNVTGGSGSSMKGGSSSYGRMWARLSLSHDFNVSAVSPFAGVEGDFALSSSDMNATTSADGIAKSLAPKSQIGLYAGIRF